MLLIECSRRPIRPIVKRSTTLCEARWTRTEEFNAEYRVIQHGHVRWMRARGRRAEPNDASRLRGVAIDVTQAKEAELQAQRDRSALGYMTRVSLLGQLSAAIAHQLNQPLAAILSNAEAARQLLRRKALDRNELCEIVDDVISEDHRAAQVIRRLSALYKNGARELQPFDVNDLVRETLALLKSDLVVRQVTATTDLTSSLPLVEGERVQLQQVLLNLIVNATDAMAGGDEQQRTLTLRTRATESGVRIEVEDHGRGISEAEIAHVFDMFWTTKPGGMGVSLSICQSIVAAHRGRLMVEGWRSNALGCLVLDVNLPGLDGLALQERLRDAGQALPIVFLTGHGDIPMSVRAIKTGAADFLTKPVAGEALTAAIRAAIDQHIVARRSHTDTEILRRRLEQLTPREREVLDELIAGKLNKQIAFDLGIVEQTVKYHRGRIMARLQARSLAELMHIVARAGLGREAGFD